MGYLLKSTASETLMSMLRAAMRGEAAISGAMAARILEEFGRLARGSLSSAQEDTPALTTRERELLRLVADGAMDKEIATELSISLSTVKTHVRSILAKLRSTSRHQAAASAVQKGLIARPGQGDVPREK